MQLTGWLQRLGRRSQNTRVPPMRDCPSAGGQALVRPLLPKRELLLFLIAILTPCLVLVALSVRILEQERQLEQKRRAEERERQVARLSQDLISRLERTKVDLAFSPVSAADELIAFVGILRSGQLVLPWDENAGIRDFRQAIGRARLSGLLRQAERDETNGSPGRAVEAGREAIRVAPSPAVQAYVRLLLARALRKAGQHQERLGHADARKSYEQLLRRYADQNEVAALARTRLSALEQAGGLSHPLGVTLRKVWSGTEALVQGSPSPDGRYLSFTDWETGDLALRDLATGQNRRLTNKGKWDDSEEYASGSIISGDGRQIGYAWYNKENYYELRVIGIDGSNPRTVYRDKEFGFWLEPWQWTSDGKQILAALMKGRYEEMRIALIPVAGEPVRFLKTQTQLPWYPSLSPDGRFLVYSAHTGVGREGDIFLLSLEGGQEIPLVRQPANDWAPVWVPDGSKVMFIRDRSGTKAFWTIDVVEGRPRGVPQLLQDGLGRAVRPNGFTRQGSFYYSTSTSIEDIYITELDPAEGKALRQPEPVLPRLGGSNLAPSWSPDGRRLAYYRRDDPFLF